MVLSLDRMPNPQSDEVFISRDGGNGDQVPDRITIHFSVGKHHPAGDQERPLRMRGSTAPLAGAVDLDLAFGVPDLPDLRERVDFASGSQQSFQLSAGSR